MTDPEEPTDGRVFRSAAYRRHTLLLVGVITGGVVAATAALWTFASFLFEPTWLQTRIEAAGPTAPVVFVLLQTTQVVFAPIPGQVLGTVGGYLFGSALGAAYSILGVILGSTLVFVASRRYGRPFAVQVLTEETVGRADAFVDTYGVPGLFVAFLLPTFPDDALCLVAGLTTIRLRTFLTLLVVGRTPTFVAAAYAGTALADGRVEQFLLILAVLVLLSAVVYGLRSRITDRPGRLTDRGG